MKLEPMYHQIEHIKREYDFGFHSIQKSNFQKNSHLNALRSKFDLDIK